MKIMMLVDIEGVSCVTTYEQAEKSKLGADMLMHDINAVLEGLLINPENQVLIYDEHTDGCNIRMEELPPSVHVVRGKPIVGKLWRGIDESYDGLVMVGFHARNGVEGALLPHTYAPQNKNIRVNGMPVGEIGMEACVAGDSGVPLVLVTGDTAGTAEAEALAPGVRTVAVKRALDTFQALCYNPAKTREMLRAAGASIAFSLPGVKPLTIPGPVTVEIDLMPGEFLKTAKRLKPECFANEETIRFIGDTATGAWREYLLLERSVHHELGI